MFADRCCCVVTIQMMRTFQDLALTTCPPWPTLCPAGRRSTTRPTTWRSSPLRSLNSPPLAPATPWWTPSNLPHLPSRILISCWTEVPTGEVEVEVVVVLLLLLRGEEEEGAREDLQLLRRCWTVHPMPGVALAPLLPRRHPMEGAHRPSHWRRRLSLRSSLRRRNPALLRPCPTRELSFFAAFLICHSCSSQISLFGNWGRR